MLLTVEPSAVLPRELKAAQIFNETVIDRLPIGVVVLDREGYVVKYNRFEERLARRQRQDVIGRSFFKDVAVCTNVPEVAGVFESGMQNNALSTEVEFEFALPFLPRPREVKIRMQSFSLDDTPFGVLLIEDISMRKELERERERLLSILVHDLNNALSGILGYTQLFEMGAIGDLEDAQDQAIRTIGESAEQMRRLITGTLADIHGRQRGRQPVNLHAVVLSVIGNQLLLAREAGIVIDYGGPIERALFPTRAVVVRGFVDQLSSLTLNLLSNALKYASREVRITLEEVGPNIVLEICDDGPGIEPEHHQGIFEEHYQVPGSKPGHGIGLFSVRRAVEIHDGTIEVVSEPGRGAMFRVSLPVDRA